MKQEILFDYQILRNSMPDPAFNTIGIAQVLINLELMGWSAGVLMED